MSATDAAPDDDLVAAFGAAPIAYVGVVTGRGPHVTPQIIAVAAGRLWFVTTERSVKVRAVAARAAVTVTAWETGAAQAAVALGEARVLDLAHPTGLADDVLETVLGTVGLAAYAVSNVREMLQTIWQAGTGQLTSAADRRVLVGVRPDQVRILAVARDADAVLAWETPEGPMAVPGTWDEASSRFVASPEARELLVGWEGSMAGVAVDRSTGVGAADRAGSLFRGPGRFSDDHVRLQVERVTTWSGSTVETVAVPVTAS